MQTIGELMNNLATEEGLNETSLSRIKIFKASAYSPRGPLCYKQGVLFVGQGSKRVYLDDKIYEYNPENYLVLTVPIPAECETCATTQKPVLLMMVDIDVQQLNHIIIQLGDQRPPPSYAKEQQGLFLGRRSSTINETLRRLLQALQTPLESHILGEALIQELMFRLICAEGAASLYALASNNSRLSQIDRALKFIDTHYQQGIAVEQLSQLVNMSPSVFHRVFKEITASTPIQYIKKIRLSRAHSLLIGQRMRVSEAAAEVGYESSTQFSREFKRYFGNSPSDYSKTKRAE
ncbi:AraC family transcriptional regulator [Desulfotalea psychrophila]|uniref:Related to transcription regulator (AraC-type) n=1 Tax=Desulfotalea psychrophila (strain LSv54 / DSM 12343) TaxID=177439 RepID=Q6AM29_DESPS|nr:AraC family transcriptional regulator [Desulfotalea psychrophila]CAG36596.1 related to transcription regulator (AraC-type) [Desulfotalea psychrophila LSv54]